MKILAFDQASAITGWALFVDGKLECSGKINLQKVKDKTERHKQMNIATIGLLEAMKPDYVMIEDVYVGVNAQSIITITRYQGLIMGFCNCHNIPSELILPTTWRKILGFTQGRNTGRAQLKKQAQEYVQRHFDLNVTQDEADAICIGYAAVCKYERSLP